MNAETPAVSKNSVATVSLQSLLSEMVDRDVIAKRDQVPYRLLQVSSYSRDAKQPGTEDWFANQDFNNYLRTENNKGREENVLMDHVGPGVIVRWWLTMQGPGVGKGTIRIYLDGNHQPVLEDNPFSLVSGQTLAGAPLSQAVSPDTWKNARGHNLFLPIPYAKRCKVTFELADECKFYSAINFREYPEGTNVETYQPDVAVRARDTIRETNERLTAESQIDVIDSTGQIVAELESATVLKPGESVKLDAKEPGALDRLSVKLSADDLPQALRSTILKIRFDGRQTVWCPVRDFFGTGYRINVVNTWGNQVDRNGRMQCRWVMPYEDNATLEIENLGDQAVTIDEFAASRKDWTWDDDSFYFHTAWKNLDSISTKRDGSPFDVNFIDIDGRGKLAGDSLTLFNADEKWWGEGDEKIYIDGEDFPSHFGTGTEDYYGYAWCRHEEFSAPFHAQPCGDGSLPTAPGLVVNSRYRALDAIPFATRIRFDMEIWHWRKTKLDYSPTVYWYATADSQSNAPPLPEEARRAVAETPADVLQ